MMGMIFGWWAVFLFDVQVVVMPLQCQDPEKNLAQDTAILIQKVLSRLPEIEAILLPDDETLSSQHAGKLFRRCGNEPDCQAEIGRLYGAQVVLTGAIQSLGPAIALDLQLLDVGTGKVIGKTSRSLLGDQAHRQAVLDKLLTSYLCPQRMRGSIKLTLDPPGGDIFLDGQLLRQSSKALEHLDELTAQEHSLQVTRSGYHDFYALVQVPFQGVTELKVNMQKREEP